MMRAIGLMSGTSLDGIDAALVDSDGERVAWVGPALTIPYDADLRDDLRAVLGGALVDQVAPVERRLTQAHADAVAALLAKANLAADDIDVIGFHGHTILHQPQQGRTWQIGDGALLARLTGRPVVFDFRSADVTAGGEGAPLVPVVHAVLAADLPGPLAVLNLGGVGNVTWIGADRHLIACDTGRGNALIDDWMLRHTGTALDQGGAVALSGQVATDRVAAFLNHDYFRRSPPKSLDRDDFRRHADALTSDLSLADGAATLVAFTAAAVAATAAALPSPPNRWLVCGGGRHNAAIMAALAEVLPAPVAAVEQVGWDGDALEALAFGVLAVRSLRGLPLSFPGTTGVPAPQTGGMVRQP